jgi:prepilin-type N-terminal cleavage/methylation domain-containing protein
LLDQRSYAADLSTLGVVTPGSVSPYYTIAIATADGPPPSFTASATPTGSQAGDLSGQPLTIANTGAKGPSGPWQETAMHDYTNRVKQATTRRLFPLRYRLVAGFTVVEMLVVVAIFGILAAITAPSFSSLMAASAPKPRQRSLCALVEARSGRPTQRQNATWRKREAGKSAGK